MPQYDDEVLQRAAGFRKEIVKSLQMADEEVISSLRFGKVGDRWQKEDAALVNVSASRFLLVVSSLIYVGLSTANHSTALSTQDSH